eukprot:3624068-Heterocapsa_arctica.AAC.1
MEVAEEDETPTLQSIIPDEVALVDGAPSVAENEEEIGDGLVTSSRARGGPEGGEEAEESAVSLSEEAAE